MKNIGIIGRGFVGSAVEFGFSAQTGCDGVNVRVFDKDPTRSINTLEETVNQSEIIFLSVPTPSNEDGSINLDILRTALHDINNVSTRNDNIVLIRSTVIPGTVSKLQAEFSRLNLVFNPEFLTERSAKFDFINQARVILGGDKKYTVAVADLYRWRFGKHISILETNYETAELIKYMCNCFFATKVSFMNEMKLIAEASGVNWEDAVNGFVSDGRVGHSHIRVPGPDGKNGFGGSCFPKDIQAIISYGASLGIETNTLQGAWKTNLQVRPDQDWKQLKGRAII